MISRVGVNYGRQTMYLFILIATGIQRTARKSLSVRWSVSFADFTMLSMGLYLQQRQRHRGRTQ